jgi:hypothetical protein
MLNQMVTKNLHIETAIGYQKGELTLGAYKQKMSMREWSIMPRYQFSSLLNLGIGVVRQMAAQFEATNGTELQFPNSTQWLVSTRTPGLDEDHYVEVAISSQQWQRSNLVGNWIARGQSDNKVNLSYSGHF